MKHWIGNRGFTLVEVIIVFSVVAIIFVATFAVVGLLEANKFQSQVQQTVGVLRQMQSNARTVENNQEYGVSFTSNSWTSFSQNPSTGTPTTIITTPLTNITVTTAFSPAASQVIFERLTGNPKNATSGTVTLAHTRSNRTKVIRVENTGVIYEQ